MPRASVSTMWWRLANRSRSRRLWQQLSIPSTPTSSRYQAGMRTPRRMRVSGIARRKLIRSRSAAEETVSGTGRRRCRRPHTMLAVPTRAAGPHFESALRGQVTLLQLAHLPVGVLFQHTLRISRSPIPDHTLNQPCTCQGKGGSLRNCRVPEQAQLTTDSLGQ